MPLALARAATAPSVKAGKSVEAGDLSPSLAAKTRAAWRAGLQAIVCVGETQQQRDAGQTLDVVGSQLAGSIPAGASPRNLVVAYEPVWAIGTGRTPTTEDIKQVHIFIYDYFYYHYYQYPLYLPYYYYHQYLQYLPYYYYYYYYN